MIFFLSLVKSTKKTRAWYMTGILLVLPNTLHRHCHACSNQYAIVLRDILNGILYPCHKFSVPKTKLIFIESESDFWFQRNFNFTHLYSPGCYFLFATMQSYYSNKMQKAKSRIGKNSVCDMYLHWSILHQFVIFKWIINYFEKTTTTRVKRFLVHIKDSMNCFSRPNTKIFR